MKKIVMLLIILSCWPGLGAAGEMEGGVGLRLVQCVDPVGLTPMSAAVFYPSEGTAGRTMKGPYLIDAVENAPIRAGSRPLVVISHGSGGSMFGHHDMASFLAGHGFIAAAIEHPGDNYRDQTARGGDRVLIGRARQVSALLTRLLDEPDFQASINPEKIGVAGFSAGGYTALLMVGALPNFELLGPYCQRHPDDPGFCRGESHPRVRLSSPPLTAAADTRIRAAFAMAPIGVFFDEAALAHIQAPVFLYGAARDQVLTPSENADRIRPMLHTLRDYRAIPEAGHYVFLAPCSAALTERVPDLCKDPPGIDRSQVHERINEDALNFFRSALD